MPDWTRSMQQTYDFVIVNPKTWADDKKITTVTNASVTRDLNDETLGSATIECDEDLTDLYVRFYLKTIQDRVTERFSLGTFLCQTPGRKFDGKRNTATTECYTPLIELKEKPMPLGFSLRKGDNIMECAYGYTRESMRAPVLKTTSATLLKQDFIASNDDTRLSFLSDLLANDKRTFGLDETSQIIFPPQQEIVQLQPRWTYDDNNSSILYPELDIERDLYGVPNVVEVLYSGNKDHPIHVEVKNDDPNSITSIQSRGREIIYRDTNPEVAGGTNSEWVTEEQVREYAYNLLKSKSSLEYTLNYKHGYCPVRIGDGVRLNYTRADLKDIRAKVIRQIITCTPGCPVQETAVFTKHLWGVAS